MPTSFDDRWSQDLVGNVKRFSYSYEVAIVEGSVTCQRLSSSALISKRICKLGAQFPGDQHEGRRGKPKAAAGVGRLIAFITVHADNLSLSSFEDNAHLKKR